MLIQYRCITADLRAVSVQSVANLCHDGLVHRRRSAKIAFTLLAHTSGKVAGARLAVHGLSLAGQAKTFFRALVGLLFRHRIALRHLCRLFEAPHFKGFTNFVLVHLHHPSPWKSAKIQQTRRILGLIHR